MIFRSLASRAAALIALIALITVLLAVPAVHAQPKELAGYDPSVQEMMKAWEVPGLAVAIVRDGEVIHAQGFGYRDVEQKLPVTPDTLFATASITKSFTTFLLGTLVDEGKLDWDRPAAAYLPGFRLHDRTATEQITTRDMVTHRSGVPRHGSAFYNRELSRGEMVELLPYLEPSFPLRARYQYSNVMYATAGHIAERITGRSWEDNVRERIFQPLGMTRANFSLDVLRRDPDHAVPYARKEGRLETLPFRGITTLAPAGAINSSVREMAKWAALHLAGGKVGGRQLIGAATLQDIHSPHMVTGDAPLRPEISPAVYGMGWLVDTYRGHRRLWHDGSVDGYTSLLTLLPDDGLGIVVLTNGHRTEITELLVRHTTDRLLGLAPIDWNGEALALRAKGRSVEQEAGQEMDRKAGTRPAHALAEYAGEYSHPGYGTMVVAVKGDGLEMTYNRLSSRLEHWHYETWTGSREDANPILQERKLLFETDVAGNVAAIRAPFEPALQEGIRFAKRPDSRMSDPAWLARFVGQYDLGDSVVSIELAGNALTATMPGDPQYHLVPQIGGDFLVKELGFRVRFEENASALIVLQPGATLVAKRKR